MQRSVKSCATAKDTTYHLSYLKCKYTHDKALCVHFVFSCEIPNRLNEKEASISLFFSFSFIVCLLVIPD